MNLDLGVQRLANQSAGQGRVDTDQALFQVQLIGADDAVARLLAVFVFNRDPSPTVDRVRVAGFFADHLEAFEALGQETHATVDFAEHFFAVGVLPP